MYRYVGYFAVIFFLLSLCCYGNALAQDDVLATIGDIKITMADLDRTIGYLDAQKQQLVKENPQLKEQLLRQMVQTIVVTDLAKKAGYDKKEDIVKRLEFFSNSFIASEYLAIEVAKKVSVSEDAMKSYYDENKEEFKTPEMVRVRHILIKVEAGASEDDKKNAHKNIEDILNKINSGEDFAQLASELSDDTITKPKGGDLGFVPRGRLVKSFEDVAFTLKPGEVSEIVETPFGYHLIKIDEKKDAGVESFDAVKARLAQKMHQEQVQKELTEFVEKAMINADVKFHTELLTEGQKKE